VEEVVVSEPIETEDEKEVILSPYILVLAMSIHAAFAGLALGLSNEMGPFLGMLLAILAHKWAESMTIGISFAKH